MLQFFPMDRGGEPFKDEWGLSIENSPHTHVHRTRVNKGHVYTVDPLNSRDVGIELGWWVKELLWLANSPHTPKCSQIPKYMYTTVN